MDEHEYFQRNYQKQLNFNETRFPAVSEEKFDFTFMGVFMISTLNQFHVIQII